jgi:hypothetical protein
MQTRTRSLSRYSSCLSLCLALCALLAASPALADQEPLPLGSIQDVKEPTTTPADMRKRADPSADRSLLFSSAETLHQGDVTINSYELIGLGVSYGITDSIELSGSTIIPAWRDAPLTLFLSGKFQVVRLPSLLFSVQTSAGILSGFPDDDDGSSTLGLSALLDVILDSQGDFVFSTSVQTGWNYFFDDSESFGLVALTLAFNARVAKIVKLLFEVVIPGGFTSDDFALVEEATVFNYGVRFFGDSIAVDLSFLRPIAPVINLDYFVMGIPYVTFSARF